MPTEVSILVKVQHFSLSLSAFLFSTSILTQQWYPWNHQRVLNHKTCRCLAREVLRPWPTKVFMLPSLTWLVLVSLFSFSIFSFYSWILAYIFEDLVMGRSTSCSKYTHSRRGRWRVASKGAWCRDHTLMQILVATSVAHKVSDIHGGPWRAAPKDDVDSLP